MNLRKSLMIFTLMLTSFGAHANTHGFIALGGQTPGKSVNIEYNAFNDLWFGTGYGYIESFGGREYKKSIPMMVNWILGETDHKVELGLGLNFMQEKEIDYCYVVHPINSYVVSHEVIRTRIIPVFPIGYRYMPAQGFTFRGGLTAHALPGIGFKMRLGLGVGYAF